jgi:hypothetical protein
MESTLSHQSSMLGPESVHSATCMFSSLCAEWRVEHVWFSKSGSVVEAVTLRLAAESHSGAGTMFPKVSLVVRLCRRGTYQRAAYTDEQAEQSGRQ